MENIYDVIIIGAGPAGLAAGIYAARARMKTLIVEKGIPGGLIVNTNEIENYPGAEENATGPSLTERMKEQADEFGAEFITDEIVQIDLNNDIKKLTGRVGTYQSKSVIIAAGAYPKTIGCKGEREHIGQGVSYCATCDGSFYTGLEVIVVGGGDAALEEAIFLTRFARKVTIVHRRDKFRAAKSIQEKAMKNEKINIRWNTIVEEINGDGIVESVIFKDTVTGEITEKKADPADGIMGVFVFVGYKPYTEIFKEAIGTDPHGYVITDEKMQTNIKGVFAAGDIRVKPLRQVVTAVSDGAIATVEAEKYIDDLVF
ncbi:MAG: thioredoxin-disulfide reductase [Clostridiales bacterium]|nr:thioredoxin-disulfide reductase [Clostridiales bacterium]